MKTMTETINTHASETEFAGDTVVSIKAKKSRKRKKTKERFQLFPTIILVCMWIWCAYILFMTLGVTYRL